MFLCDVLYSVFAYTLFLKFYFIKGVIEGEIYTQGNSLSFVFSQSRVKQE